jgi:hypothetical protein
MSIRAWPSLAVVLAVIAGCDKPAPPPAPIPTERARPFVPAVSPLLNELEDDEAPMALAHAGDLATVVRTIRPMRWKSKTPTEAEPRDGMTVELHLAPEGTHFFGWEPDLGPEVQVPAASWICANHPAETKDARCGQLLHRNRLPDGGLVAYVPCNAGSCAIALVRDGRVSAIKVEGLVSFYVTRGAGGRPIGIATTRWVRADGAWSGGSLVPIRIEANRLVTLPTIPLDEIDARDAQKVTYRMVKLEPVLKAGEMVAARLVGERREVARADARELSKASIDETIALER